MFVWKPPAQWFVIIALFCGVISFWTVFDKTGLPDEAGAAASFCVAGLVLVITDTLWRAHVRLPMLDVRASSLYWIFPTWGAGVLLMIGGAIACLLLA